MINRPVSIELIGTKLKGFPGCMRYQRLLVFYTGGKDSRGAAFAIVYYSAMEGKVINKLDAPKIDEKDLNYIRAIVGASHVSSAHKVSTWSQIIHGLSANDLTVWESVFKTDFPTA